MSPLHCIYDRGGIHLPALDLWLDATKARKGTERVFVSHAHSDHIAAHRETILSPATARLMRSRLPGKRMEHALGWHEPRTFEHGAYRWTITLLPAGHVLGSAMALIEVEGQTLLYTGDFKLRPGPASEPCHPARADRLIMETTFGRPGYVFPSVASVLADIQQFCQQTFDCQETPVLLGYSLGKSQEVLAGLADSGWTFALHPQVAKLTRIYENFGQRFAPHEELTRDGSVRGKVVLCPPGMDARKYLGNAGPIRKAVLTGWALNPSCRFRYQADAAFPLSDHADFPDLHAFVRQVQPKEIFTVHGFASDFAQSLRDEGFAARSLSENDQLHLALGLRPGVPPPKNKNTP